MFISSTPPSLNERYAASAQLPFLKKQKERLRLLNILRKKAVKRLAIRSRENVPSILAELIAH
jgi:hypothetical protein